MNLFLLSWNLPEERFLEVLSELHKMTEIYPQLDSGTIWHWGRGGNHGTAFAASMHTSDHAAAPRRYVWRTDDQVTFYDGCLVDPTGSFKAHDAKALSWNWDRLSGVLEGQFIVVRLSDNPLRIELLTDFLGMGQVYYLQQRDMWLVSNSVGLILRICEASTLDPLGISMFLSVDFVGADRTLRRDIRVIPGGQLWKWQQGETEPSRKVYFSRPKLVRKPHRVFTESDSRKLADELIRICRALSQSFGELTCPLTGGRDSRLLASLLISGGIQARYYTDGTPGSADVEIGAQVAKACDLPHRVNIKTTEEIVENWDPLCRRLIQQNDGMVSLWQIADVLEPTRVDHLNIRLWGAGGAIARGFYTKPSHFLRQLGLEDIQEYLTKRRVKDYGGLIRHEAVALAKEYLQQFVVETIDDGFSFHDVPDVFHAYEEVRRWSGSNARKVAPIFDLFAPLVTRPFVEAAFALSAIYRYSEPLHYQLTRLLMPELHRLSSQRGPWRSQRPFVNVLRWMVDRSLRQCGYGRIRYRFFTRKWKPCFDRSAYLAAKRNWLREVCLDQSDSILWTFVNRPLFESITSDAACLARQPRHFSVLYRVATLFSYFSS